MSNTLLSRPVRMLKKKLRTAMNDAVPRLSQGRHVDPEDPAAARARPRWSAAQAAAFTSPEMNLFRECLRLDGDDVRACVLDDLATYHDISPEEALQRCLDWEALSVQEWQAEDRAEDEARVRFYRTMQSWSYDLLWYAYLQAEGYADPASVLAFQWLDVHARGRRHLDYGSGVGITSQLFLRRGWSCTLADISSTLLEFARFRLERRGEHAGYLDLVEQALPSGGYDAVTAIDALAHVPDIHGAARDLHAALSPGGLLLANFDVRPPSPENAWHLYDDDLRARYDLQRAGFRPIARLGYGLTAYQRVERTGPAAALRRGRDWVTLASPPRRWVRRIGRPALRALHERGVRRAVSAGGVTGPRA